EEILASQQRMLLRKGIPHDPVADAEMARLFTSHLAEMERWLAAQENFTVIYLWYNELLSNPQQALHRLDEFFRRTLDVSRMAEIIDPALYRNRKSE
ncbi:MAG: sulfotransferase family protein, partial [Calditrichaeota bacterium]|nr:sulfotransferase family protein [Calditrichota bacterium]